MNPWAVWLDPWETYLGAWSKALGGHIIRLHNARDADDITLRQGAMPFRVALEGDNFALLDFSRDDRVNDIAAPTLIITPYALHDWRVADLAHDHSVIETLLAQGVQTLYVLAWKSANFETRHHRIDAQFEALRTALGHLGKPVQAIGLCQGGWLSLAYAARFPDAFSRLALIGAPVDFRSSARALQTMDDPLIDASINWLALAGGGVIRGWSTQCLWQIKFGERADCAQVLQEQDAALRENPALHAAYEAWDRDVLDLPPAYFGDVLKHLYRDNDMYEGRFQVLGQCVSLASVMCPILILAGRADEIVPASQILAVTHSVSTAPSDITILYADGGHLALFLGRQTLHDQWPDIARWLLSDTRAEPH